MAQTQITQTDDIPHWAAPDDDSPFVIGSSVANAITTFDGSDVIDGGAGNDAFHAGLISHWIAGSTCNMARGAGDDTYHDIGHDHIMTLKLTEYANEGTDTVEVRWATITRRAPILKTSACRPPPGTTGMTPRPAPATIWPGTT